MYRDLKRLFWWLGMKKDIVECVYACLICSKSKIEHQKPSGLMTLLFVPEWKLDSISMNFVEALPKNMNGSDLNWVVVDRFTKSAHFIPIKIDMSLRRLAKIYIEQIVRLHDIPSSIVLDRYPRFTSKVEFCISSSN